MSQKLDVPVEACAIVLPAPVVSMIQRTLPWPWSAYTCSGVSQYALGLCVMSSRLRTRLCLCVMSSKVGRKSTFRALGLRSCGAIFSNRPSYGPQVCLLDFLKSPIVAPDICPGTSLLLT